MENENDRLNKVFNQNELGAWTHAIEGLLGLGKPGERKTANSTKTSNPWGQLLAGVKHGGDSNMTQPKPSMVQSQMVNRNTGQSGFGMAMTQLVQNPRMSNNTPRTSNQIVGSGVVNSQIPGFSSMGRTQTAQTHIPVSSGIGMGNTNVVGSALNNRSTLHQVGTSGSTVQRLNTSFGGPNVVNSQNVGSGQLPVNRSQNIMANALQGLMYTK